MTWAIGYIVLGLIVGRIVARHEYQDSLSDPKYRGDAASDALSAFFWGGTFWPITVFVYFCIGIYKVCNTNVMVSAGNSAYDLLVRAAVGKPVSEQKKRDELEKRRERVRELEAELEL